MKRIVLFLLSVLISLPTVAEPEWVTVAESDDTAWAIQAGSLEQLKTKGGTPIIVVVGRIANGATRQIDLFKWYVSLEDCRGQMGKLVTLGIDGQYRFENDFVVGSGNIASAVAESICGAHQYRVNVREKKGI